MSLLYESELSCDEVRWALRPGRIYRTNWGLAFYTGNRGNGGAEGFLLTDRSHRFVEDDQIKLFLHSDELWAMYRDKRRREETQRVIEDMRTKAEGETDVPHTE